MSSLIVFKPGVTLAGGRDRRKDTSQIPQHYRSIPYFLFTFRALLTSLKSSIFSLDLRVCSHTKKRKCIRGCTHKKNQRKWYTDWLRCSPISCRACSCCSHFCCSCFFSCFSSCSSCRINLQETRTMTTQLEHAGDTLYPALIYG